MTERQAFITNNVDIHRDMILSAERWLWAHPQTGYTEWEAHNYLCEHFEKLYGRPADKTKKLYNGMIPCYLYQYFKPAERIAEEKKGSKKNFQKKI